MGVGKAGSKIGRKTGRSSGKVKGLYKITVTSSAIDGYSKVAMFNGNSQYSDCLVTVPVGTNLALKAEFYSQKNYSNGSGVAKFNHTLNRSIFKSLDEEKILPDSPGCENTQTFKSVYSGTLNISTNSTGQNYEISNNYKRTFTNLCGVPDIFRTTFTFVLPENSIIHEDYEKSPAVFKIEKL
ncbi:MAG: hypothetical protein LC658_03745 [Bacteroidales bacterium]|nr:hypothetical protein [Bacteroidales bacterium]